jgi:hypothetical protein
MRVLATAFLLFSASACTNPFASRRDITLYIADVVVPTTVSASGKFTATITYETGGCRQFERFDVTKRSTSATIRVRGTDAGGNTVCTTDIRYEKKTLDLNGPFSDPFTITAIQPDASSLVRTVRVQ